VGERDIPLSLRGDIGVYYFVFSELGGRFFFSLALFGIFLGILRRVDVHFTVLFFFKVYMSKWRSFHSKEGVFLLLVIVFFFVFV